MSSKYLMAIDAGTGSVRTVIFDFNGNQLGAAQYEWQHKEDPRYPGSMDFDYKSNWDITVKSIKEALAKTNINPSDIAAAATTSMREGIILYDEDGNEIWACANVDARSNNEVCELAKIEENIERSVYMLSGQTFALGALPRLLWVKNNMPEVYKKTKTLTMFNDWLIYKLTGILSAEPSNGCTTGIFDIASRKWSPDIAAKCGLKQDIFPPVYECGSVVGNVSASCATETGLSQSTLVVAGGGDAQLGAIGAGVVSDKQTAVFGGSFWQLEQNTANPKPDSECRIRLNCHAVPNIWQYEAIAFYPGLVMRWYRDAFCQQEKEIEQQTGVEVYEQMNKYAAQIPAGCYGMMCAFSDVMDYISWRHAAPTFTNFALEPEKFNRYTFYRAIMENAAMITKGHMDLVKELTDGSPEYVVFANGASKSTLWCQIMADVLGVTVKVPQVKETTALGAAMCAAVGAGVYQDIESACAKMVAWDKEYHPIAANSETYNAMYKPWREMYKKQLSLADEKITNHMWKAPGL